MSSRIPVTILGATGLVGQRFVRRLASHPAFEIRHLAASARSLGKPYGDACHWHLDGPSHAGRSAQLIEACDPDCTAAPVVFSALDADVARELEPAFARRGCLVFSNASAFRLEPDVPLLVPEVNPAHLGLLGWQQARRGWAGGILTNPNCTTTMLVMALAPLHQAFGVEAVLMSSMQAVSGAGYPGVSSLDLLGNVIPFIPGEEQKVETEAPKLLGTLGAGGVEAAGMAVSALCHRVPVLEGHTVSVSVRLKGDPLPEAVMAALEAWAPEPQRLGLPSAPERSIRLHRAEDRPQVRRDVERDGGMSVHVGRVRRCPILGIKFTLLGHNTERGAAGGSLLNAELALASGVIR